MTVVYRLEPTERTPHDVRERLLTTACPSCGADWTRRGAALPRHEGGRTFRCEACGEHHRAVEVDSQGRPATTPRSWGLARQQREHDEATPAPPEDG